MESFGKEYTNPSSTVKWLFRRDSKSDVAGTGTDLPVFPRAKVLLALSPRPCKAQFFQVSFAR